MKTRWGFLVVVFVGFIFIMNSGSINAPSFAQTKKGFTEWGWPLPYEKVSEKSIKYLKEKGWWPVKWAYQPPWMAEATIPWIIKKMELGKKRGLEVEMVGLLSGPDINEGLASGKFAVGNGGDFPVTSLSCDFFDRQEGKSQECRNYMDPS